MKTIFREPLIHAISAYKTKQEKDTTAGWFPDIHLCDEINKCI